jgi:polygalacturonase
MNHSGTRFPSFAFPFWRATTGLCQDAFLRRLGRGSSFFPSLFAVGLVLAAGLVSVRAEYGYFSDVKSGSDIVMKEVRWPYWNNTYYNTWWSDNWTSSEGTSGYFYNGLALPPATSSNPVGTPQAVNFSFWPLSNPVNVTDTIVPAYTSPSTFAMPTIAEGTLLRSPGKWSLWQTNVWYRMAIRTWTPTDGTPHQGYAGTWLRDPVAGVWYHMATVQLPFAVTGIDGSMSFQENASGGYSPQRTDYRRCYYRYGGTWRSSTNWYVADHAGAVENTGLIETNSAVYYETCKSNGVYAGKLTNVWQQSPTLTLTQAAAPVFDPILVTNCSAVAYGSQVLVQWQTPPASSPQFAYQVDVYTNAGYTGSVVATVYDIAPEARQKLVNIGTNPTPYVRLTIIDVFNQTNTPVNLTPTNGVLSAAKAVSGLVNGLSYAYYQSASGYTTDAYTNWAALPNFAALAPVLSGAVSGLDLTPRLRRDGYAFNYTGYLNVASNGLYAFTLNSCDGARLYVDGQMVINGDGKHSAADLGGGIALQAGYHALNVQYFFDTQPSSLFSGQYFDSLTLSYEGPGIPKTPVPATAFYRAPGGAEPSVTLTAPATGATLAGTAVPLAATVAAGGNSVGKVQFYDGNYFWGQDAAAPYALTSLLWASSSNALRARLVYNGTNTLDSPVVSLTTTNPGLSPWQNNQVFYHNQPNGAGIQGGTYSLIGDGFNLLAQPITGDCALVARLANITSAGNAPDGSAANSGWQAGIILRGNTNMTPGYPWGHTNTAPFTALFGQVDGGTYYQDETMANGGGGYASGNLGGQKWMRLQRTGNTFTSFVSNDGFAWTPVWTNVLNDFPATLYAGFFTYAGPSSNPNVHQAAFDNVNVTVGAYDPLAAALSPWSLLINTNNILFATNYGASVANADNAAYLQAAINGAAAGGTTNGLSGGTVRVSAGTYLCGPIAMKSCVNLQLDAGAVLRMLPYGTYPGSPYTNGATHFIAGTNLHDLEISGSGAVDGQGQPWWDSYGTNKSVSRPKMMYFSGCTRLLVQDVTLSNSPMFHIATDSAHNAAISRVTVQAPPSSGIANPSHNTDACDIGGTNILVENCNISVGDDDYACGGGTHDVLLTNNIYGAGHGLSVGSYTDSGGVSNFTIVHCGFYGTSTGIRIKSDNDRGGVVQNMNYLNVLMTNVDQPIVIYGYYSEFGSPSAITPQQAATQAVAAATSLTPAYRNLTFSNLNITASSGLGYAGGIIWARTELPATNIVFNRVNLTADNGFDIYNAAGVQFVDCNLTARNGGGQIMLFDAQATVTNSAPTNTLFTFDGITTNGYGSTLALYNANGSLSNTNAFDDGPLTLSAGTFTVNNNLTLFPSTVLNYTLGNTPASVAVNGNLALGGGINLAAGPGFTNGIYPLMTYTGSLGGNLPVLGLAPAGYTYVVSSNSPGKVNLLVLSAADAAVAGLYFQQPPTGTNAGAVMAPVTVVVTNASGGRVTNAMVTVSLASGSGVLNGTLARATDPTGVASFADLSLSTVGTKQLSAMAGTNLAASASFYITSLAATNVQPVAAIFSNNPVAYWRLNEPTGPTAYDAMGSYNGAGEGGIAFGVAGVYSPLFTGFELNNLAARFNGTDADIALPALNLNTNAVTITGWLNLAGLQVHGAGLFFCRSGATVAGLVISSASTTNQLGYNWNNNSSTYGWNSGLIVPTNQWVFAALAVSATNAVVYMGTNGTLVSATNAVANAAQAFAGTTYLGYDPNQSIRRLNGVMDEVAVFNQTLSAAQVGQLYLAATNAPAPVVGAVSVTRNAGSAYRLSISSLVAAATDPDGFALSVTGVDAVTSGGSALSLDGANLASSTTIYIPATAAEGDTFHFTVGNGHGGVTVGTVTIHVAAVAGQLSGLLSVDSSGNVHLTFFGVPSQTYSIQRATNLTPPVAWNSLSGGPFTADAGTGIIMALDSIGSGAAYYRLSTNQ